MNRTLNAVVVGVGALGQHHARIYANNPKIRLLGVVDTNAATAQVIAERWKTRSFQSLDEIQEPIDLVSVAVPTLHHFEIASWCIERNIPLLIEKPIAMNIEEGSALVHKAEEQGVLLQVGHIERFNPAVVALGEYLERPLFIESHRLGPPVPRVTDVGVILDLMIHDLDLILSLVRSEVKSIDAVGVPILTAQEDIANARIRFESGCLANVTVSRVTPERQRKIRFFQKDTYLSLDYMKPDLQIYKKIEKNGQLSIEHTKPELHTHEPLAAEIDSFINCVIEQKEPIVTGRDGVRALHLAEIITEQVKEVSQSILDLM